MGPWRRLRVGLEGIKGGRKWLCGRGVSFSFCNRKPMLPQRNPYKFRKMLTLGALCTPLSLSRLWTLDSRGSHFGKRNPLWENADSKLDTLLVLVYMTPAQRGEEINPRQLPRSAAETGSGSSLPGRSSFCGTLFPRTPGLPAVPQEPRPPTQSLEGPGEVNRTCPSRRASSGQGGKPALDAPQRGGARCAGAVAARLGRGGAQLHTWCSQPSGNGPGHRAHPGNASASFADRWTPGGVPSLLIARFPPPRATFGVPREIRRRSGEVTAWKSKFPGCSNSDVEMATERSLATGGDDLNYVFPGKTGEGWGWRGGF